MQNASQVLFGRKEVPLGAIFAHANLCMLSGTFQLRWEATNLFKPNSVLYCHPHITFMLGDRKREFWLSQINNRASFWSTLRSARRSCDLSLSLEPPSSAALRFLLCK